MKALVVSILVNGMHAGFLEYNDNTWDVCRDLIDAKLFAEDDVYSVEYDAKQYVKYQGSEYTYEIKTVTLTLG